MTIPSALVTRLEVYRGTRRDRAKGATRGALIGAGVGIILGAIAASTEGSNFEFGPEYILAGAGFFFGIGAGIGTLAPSREEVWEPVQPTPPAPAVTAPIAQGIVP